MAKRIMAILFIPEILCEFSYSGRGNKKRPFEKLLVNKIIFGKLNLNNIIVILILY